MGRFSRSLILRVLAGLLIGIGMFYFRQAHAQDCPAGQTPGVVVTQIQPGIGGIQPTCAVGDKFTSKAAALSACMPADGTVSADGGIKIIGRANPNNSNSLAYYYGTNPAGSYVGESGGQVAAACVGCPEGQHYNGTQCVADACPAAGTKDTRLISGTPGGNYCTQVANGSNCGVTVTIGMNIVGNGGSSTWNERTYTGQTCPTKDDETNQPTQPIQTPAGTFTPDASQDADASNGGGCGYMDNKYICLGKPTANGRCTITPNGGAVCVTSTDPNKPAAQKPDNGVPGRPAIPQATATSTPTGGSPSATTEMFSPTQVNTSTNYKPGDTTGNGDGEGEGEGSDTGAFKGPGGSAKTFGESLSDFKGRVSASQVGSALNGFADGVPTGGTCPTASFQALGRTFNFNAHCPLLDQFKSTIAAIFLLGWALYATILFFKA